MALIDLGVICRKVVIVKIRPATFIGLNNSAVNYTMVLIFGLALFLLSSIQLFDALAIIAVVTTQVTLGGLIWRKIRGAGPLEHSEFLGMGSATGFSLALLSSQIFLGVLPRSVGWLVLLVVALVLLHIFYRAPVGETKLENEQPINRNPRFELLVICCGTLVALSTSWYWLVPTALVSTGFVAWLLLRENFAALGAKSYWAYKAILIPLGYYAVRALLNLTHVETIRNPNWWSLRFGVLQDPDVVFNESMINSVQRFGASDNIFFAGYPLQYHWLSFAWEATLKSNRDLAPFAISGIAAPAIVYFAIISLAYYLARRLSNNAFAPPATVAVISMMCAGPIPLFRALNPYSFSYNFSLIFIFAIIILLLEIDRRYSLIGVVAFGIFVFVAIGSKLSNAAGIAAGLLALVVAALSGRFNFQKVFTFCCVAVSAAALFWLFAYRASGATSQTNIRVDFGEIFIQKANYSWSSSNSVLILGFISVGIATLYPLTGFLLRSPQTGASRRIVNCFAISGGLSLLVFAVFLADDLESSSYLLCAGLAILIPFSISNLFNGAEKQRPSSPTAVLLAVLVGLVSAYVWRTLYEELDANELSTQTRQSLILVIPMLVSIAFALLALLILRRARFAIVAFAITMISSSAGSFIANAGSFYSAGVASRSGSTEIAEPIIGSNEYRELLSWVKDHSANREIIATNRQCLEVRSNPKECLALWSLTSAITGRQNLVEGLYPPNSESQNKERDRRMSIIIGFVDNPSDENRDALVAYGVKWVIADKAITNTRDWQPFATVRFENPAGSILELNP
ncbi:MAG: hypothetical protein EB144_03990, partial [Actinobacteria bacterium]|nr:hypothetical protein [Actinomycetota bacterium]